MKLSKTFQRFIWIYAIFCGFNGLRILLTSFSHPDIYRKDFVASFLLTQALLAGVDPYQSVSTLATQFALNSPLPIFPHPTPHTVPAGLLIMPFSFWGYERAAQLWCVFELFCLAASLVLLARWWQREKVQWGKVCLLGWALLGWGPVTEGLWTGQFNTALLLILILAWQALRSGKEISGGLWLGGAIALKLTAWPVVLFLILQRRWRSVLAAGIISCGFHLLSAALIGFEGVARYYTTVGPAVTKLYRGLDANYSASALGWRLFNGTASSFQVSIKISPLIKWELAAKICSVLFPALVLVIGLWLAKNSPHFDTSFALLICVSLLVNPVAWSHYFTILILPLAILFWHLQQANFPAAPTRSAAVFVLISSLSADFWRQAAGFFQRASDADGSLTVPFAAGLLTFACAFALFALMALLWRNHRAAPSNTTELYAIGD